MDSNNNSVNTDAYQKDKILSDELFLKNRKKVITRFFSIIFLIYALFFAGLNIVLGRITPSVFLIITIFFTGFVFIANWKNKILLSSRLLMCCGVFLYSFLFYDGGIANTGILWSFTFPIITLFLMGKKEGRNWIIFLLINNVIITFFAFINIITIKYSLLYVVISLSILVLMHFLIHIYENSREKTEELLNSKNHYSEIINERLTKAKFEIEKINEISKQVSLSTDINVIIDNVFTYIEETFGFNSVILNLVNKNRTHYTLAFTKADESSIYSDTKGKNFPLNPDEGGRVADSIINNKVYYFHDVKSEQIENEVSRKMVESFNIQSALLVPVAIGSNVLGCLSLSGIGVNVILSEHEIESIQMFVNQIAITIRNLRLLEETLKKQKELEKINEISKQVSLYVDLKSIIDNLFSYIKESYGYNSLNLNLINKSRTHYIIEIVNFSGEYKSFESDFLGSSFPLNPVDGGRVADCIVNNKIYSFFDVNPEKIENEFNKKYVKMLNIKSAIHIPIVIGDEVFGSFSLYASGVNVILTEDEIESIQMFVNQIAITLRNIKLLEETVKKQKEIEKINEISKQVSLSVDLKSILTNLFSYIKDRYGFNSVNLNLVNKNRTHYNMEFVKFHGKYKKFEKDFLNSSYPLNSENGGRVADCILNNQIYSFYNIIPEKIKNKLNRTIVEKFEIESGLHVPIVVGNEVFGSFTLYGMCVNVILTEDDIESIQMFVNQIAITIRNVKLLEESVKRQKEIEKIDEISKQVSLSVDLEAIFNNIFSYMKDRYGFNSVFLNLVNKHRTHYKAEFIKLDEKFADFEKLFINKIYALNSDEGGRIADCILNNKIYYYHDINPQEVEYEVNKNAVEILYLKSILHVPIVVGDKVLGSFTLLGMNVNVILSDDEINSIKMFVNQIAITLRNIRLLDETLRRQEEIEQLNEITKIIGISLNFDTVFNKILNYLKTIYSFEGAFITLVDDNRTKYTIVKSYFPDKLSDIQKSIDMRSSPLNLEEGGIVALSITKNKHYFFTDIDPDKLDDDINKHYAKIMRLKTILHVPIFLDDNAIGTLSLTSHSYSFYITDDDIELIKRFVNQIAVTLRNVRLYEIIEKEKAFSENLLNKSPFAIQVIHKDARLIYINPACRTISGYEYKNIIGTNYLNYESIKKCGFDKAFLRAIEGEYIKMEDVNFTSSITGKISIINITFSPIYGKNNEIENVLVMYYDNTEKAQAMHELKTALDEIKQKNKIIHEDMLMAKRIQTNLISRIGSDYKFDFDIYFKPMMEVGGDIYDVFPINENHYRIFIADATGHGVQAALTTMIIKSEYDKIKSFDITPNLVMNIMNSAFYTSYNLLTVFFTCTILDINLITKEITYSSAGHPDQYLVSKDDVIALQGGGMMVGVYDKVDYILKKVDLPDEAKIFLFTDGIFEEFSSDEEEFGEQRLFEIIKKNKNKSIKEINKAILKSINKWIGKGEYNDDIILIGIEKNNIKKI